MSDWVRKLFIERSDLFLTLLNERWARTEEVVNGMISVLKKIGIKSGNLLDLCCGNGRISIYMAKKGFKAVGVDISKVFIEDAEKKAKAHRVSKLTTFLEGDVRELKEVIGNISRPFDVVVSAWTSIGYSSRDDDYRIFRQARELSKKHAILLIAETMHRDYISLKFVPTSYYETENIVRLESRKYDPITSQMCTTWAFYRKHGEDLKFVDKVEITHHIYSLTELCSLLKRTGWKTEECYGSFATQQPISPLTSLNLVAKAC